MKKVILSREFIEQVREQKRRREQLRKIKNSKKYK